MSEELLQLDEDIRRLSTGSAAHDDAGEKDSDSRTVHCELLNCLLLGSPERVLSCQTLQKQRLVLQREHALALARARAAGFGIEHIPALLRFAERFKAKRLRWVCCKFSSLWQRIGSGSGGRGRSALEASPAREAASVVRSVGPAKFVLDDFSLRRLSSNGSRDCSASSIKYDASVCNGWELTGAPRVYSEDDDAPQGARTVETDLDSEGQKSPVGAGSQVDNFRQQSEFPESPREQRMRFKKHQGGRSPTLHGDEPGHEDNVKRNGEKVGARGSGAGVGKDGGELELELVRDVPGARRDGENDNSPATVSHRDTNSAEEGRLRKVAAKIAFFERGLKVVGSDLVSPASKSRNSTVDRWEDLCSSPVTPPTAVAQGGFLVMGQQTTEGRSTNDVVERSERCRSGSSHKNDIADTGQKAVEVVERVTDCSEDDGNDSRRHSVSNVGVAKWVPGKGSSRTSVSPFSMLRKCQQTETIENGLDDRLVGDWPCPSLRIVEVPVSCKDMEDAETGSTIGGSFPVPSSPRLLRQDCFGTTVVVSAAGVIETNGCRDGYISSSEHGASDVAERDRGMADDRSFITEEEEEKRLGIDGHDAALDGLSCGDVIGREKGGKNPDASDGPLGRSDSGFVMERSSVDNESTARLRDNDGAAGEMECGAGELGYGWARQSLPLRGWKPLVNATDAATSKPASAALPPKIPAEFKSAISPWQAADFDSENSAGGSLHIMSPDADLPKRINWPTSLTVLEEPKSPIIVKREGLDREQSATEDDDDHSADSSLATQPTAETDGALSPDEDHDDPDSEEIGLTEQQTVVMEGVDKKDPMECDNGPKAGVLPLAGDAEEGISVVKDEPSTGMQDHCRATVTNELAQPGSPRNARRVVDEGEPGVDKRTIMELDQMTISTVMATTRRVTMLTRKERDQSKSSFHVHLCHDEGAKEQSEQTASPRTSRVRRTKSEIPAYAFGLEKIGEGDVHDESGGGRETLSDGEGSSGKVYGVHSGSSYHERRDAWLREKREKTNAEREAELNAMTEVMQRKKSQILGQLLERPTRTWKSATMSKLETVDEDLGYGVAEAMTWEMEAEEMIRTNGQIRVQELLQIWRAEVEKELSRKQEDDQKKSEGLRAQHRVEQVLSQLETLLDHHSRGPLSVSVAAASITATIKKARGEPHSVHSCRTSRPVDAQRPTKERFASGLMQEGSNSKAKTTASSCVEPKRAVGSGVTSAHRAEWKWNRAISASSRTGSSVVSIGPTMPPRAASAPSQRSTGKNPKPHSLTPLSTPSSALKTKRVAGNVASPGFPLTGSVSKPVKKDFYKAEGAQDSPAMSSIEKSTSRAKQGHRRTRSDGGWSAFGSSVNAQFMRMSVSDMGKKSGEASKPCSSAAGDKDGVVAVTSAAGREMQSWQTPTARKQMGARVDIVKTPVPKSAGPSKALPVDNKVRRNGKTLSPGNSSETVNRLVSQPSTAAVLKPTQSKEIVRSTSDNGGAGIASGMNKGMTDHVVETKAKSFLRKGTGIGSGNRMKPIMQLESDMRFMKSYMSPEPVKRSISVGAMDRPRAASFSNRIEDENDPCNLVEEGGKTRSTEGKKLRQRSKSALAGSSVSTIREEGKVIIHERQRSVIETSLENASDKAPSTATGIDGGFAVARKCSKASSIQLGVTAHGSKASSSDSPSGASCVLRSNPPSKLEKMEMEPSSTAGSDRTAPPAAVHDDAAPDLQGEQGLEKHEIRECILDDGVLPVGATTSSPQTEAKEMQSVTPAKQVKEKGAARHLLGAGVPAMRTATQGLRGLLGLSRLASAGGGGTRKTESRVGAQRALHLVDSHPNEPVGARRERDSSNSRRNDKAETMNAGSHPDAVTTGMDRRWP